MNGSRLIFLSLVVAVLAGLHYYLWLRLVKQPSWPPPWRTVFTALIVLAAVGLPASLFLAAGKPPHEARWIAGPGYVWMGLGFLLFVGCLFADVFALIDHVRHRDDTPERRHERRVLLRRVAAGGVALAAGGLSVFAIGSAIRRPARKDVDIALARWPAERDGFVIVQLTDLHVGPLIGKEFIEEVVARTNEMQPDVVAITGDLMDGSVETLAHATAPLANLRAKHGVFFVTGNHEYYSGVGPWMKELARLGIRVLRNEHVTIGSGAEAFDLAGVDDYTAHRFGQGHGMDLGAALAGRDPDRPVVLLAHQPRGVEDAAKKGVDLQISGHTHGGQIWPFGALVRLAQPFVTGLGTFGPTKLYVSAGTGYWGPPMRLGTRAEVTRLTLRRG